MKAGARSPTKAFAAFRMGGFQNFLRLAEAPPTQARWPPTLRQSLPYLPPLPGRSPIHSVSWRRPPQSSTLAPPNGHQAHTGDWLFAHGKITIDDDKHTHIHNAPFAVELARIRPVWSGMASRSNTPSPDHTTAAPCPAPRVQQSPTAPLSHGVAPPRVPQTD